MSSRTGPGGLTMRWAVADDASAIACMSHDFRLELGENVCAFDEQAIMRDGFCDKPEFEVVLAEVDGAICGYTLFLQSYEPAHAARGLYLADLYVTPAHRCRGIRRALIAVAAAEARRRERVFVWWIALAGNAGGQAFYDKLGVAAVPMFAYAATPYGMFEQLADEALPIERTH